jgi:hypothetical protein
MNSLFVVGDKVREKFPLASADREPGTITKAYELSGEYRYVVRFESGREAVYFEKELVRERA